MAYLLSRLIDNLYLGIKIQLTVGCVGLKYWMWYQSELDLKPVTIR